MHWKIVRMVDAKFLREPELAKLIPERIADIRSGQPLYFGPNKNYLNEIPKEILLSVTENFSSLSKKDQYYIAGVMIVAEKGPRERNRFFWEHLAIGVLEHVHAIHLLPLESLNDDAIKLRSELIKKDI